MSNKSIKKPGVINGIFFEILHWITFHFVNENHEKMLGFSSLFKHILWDVGRRKAVNIEAALLDGFWGLNDIINAKNVEATIFEYYERWNDAICRLGM